MKLWDFSKKMLSLRRNSTRSITLTKEKQGDNQERSEWSDKNIKLIEY